MKLIIAEKPQLATAIKEAIGDDFKRYDGYYENSKYYISWCIGHLLEVMLPNEKEKWDFDKLPLTHNGWYFEVKENTKKQYDTIKKLLSQSDEIINAGDPDEEGQLIVDSILFKENIIDLKGGSKKTIKRLLVNDFNTNAIKKELENLKDNNDYLKLSYMALSRSLADKIFGYNLTRGYSLKNNQAGNSNVISIGRVQTPMLALIVRREQEIKNHIKSYYYTIKGLVSDFNEKSLTFLYKPQDIEIDENKKISNQDTADNIIKRLNDNKDNSIISKYEVKEEIENVPLPYNLLDLQVDCSKLYNMKADIVMSITQDLREKHKAITYNRSDCNYLLDETYEESPLIIACLQDIKDDKLQNIINNANIDIKSKAFNSSKTTAHTAIIPTQTKLDFSKLSDDEKKVFLLIANRFVMQFLPPAKYLKHTITIQAGDDILINNHRQLKEAGFKKILGNKEENDDIIDNIDYNKITENQKIEHIEFISTKEETKPKKLYAMDTFLSDLKRVAIYCKDEKIKKLLKEKDKDKAGESGGIGTPATRSALIKTLYSKGYVKDDKKNIVSTYLGRELIALLPDTITYPDMTALWHESISQVGDSMENLDKFINEVVEFSANEVENIKNSETTFKSNAIKCPNCNTGYILKRQGKYGAFWSCSNQSECNTKYPDNNNQPDIYVSVSCPVCEKGELLKYRGKNGAYWKCKNPECSKTFNDDKGKPDLSVKEKPIPSEQYRCLECNSKLIRRQSKDQKGYFWGCYNYPKCKSIYKDNNGEPVYQKD